MLLHQLQQTQQRRLKTQLLVSTNFTTVTYEFKKMYWTDFMTEKLGVVLHLAEKVLERIGKANLRVKREQ